jgi:PKD repeat protein
MTLSVRDDNGSWCLEEASVTVHFNEVQIDLPPVAVIMGPTDGTVDVLVTLSGTGSYDPDGVVASWMWALPSHPDIVLDGGETATASFVPDEPGTYIVNLTVRDDAGHWSEPVEWDVEVDGPDMPPTADAGPDLATTVGGTAELTGEASSDGEGPVEAWEWECTSHQGLPGLYDLDRMVLTFTPDAPGTYTFSLRVRDGAGQWSDPDSATVTVVEVDSPPTVTVTSPNDGEDLPAGEVTIEGTASDDNGIEMVEVSVDGVSWTACTGTDAWTVGLVMEGWGPRTVQVRVTDSAGNTATGGVTFSLEKASDPRNEPTGTGWALWGVLLVVVAGAGIGLFFARRGRT